jgi:hypothetical protein
MDLIDFLSLVLTSFLQLSRDLLAIFAMLEVLIRVFCIIIISTYKANFHCYLPSYIIIYTLLDDF